MPRVLVAKDGKVIPGQEAQFQKLAKEQGEKLKEAYQSILNEDPTFCLDKPEPIDWEKEGAESLHSAAGRLGCGEIWVRIDDPVDNFIQWVVDTASLYNEHDQTAVKVAEALAFFYRQVVKISVDEKIDASQGWKDIAELYSHPMVSILESK